jgi:AmmeMemoRadiSam system protein A
MSLNDANRKTLLDIARQAIEYGIETDGAKHLAVDPEQYDAALREEHATFVTLELNGELRGCIGTLEAQRPLVADVAYNAHAAAFRDPRFYPLQASELNGLDIHISVLSPAYPMTFSSEEDLIAQLRPGEDGLILQDGPNKGTFLPSVWESVPQPAQFLAHLKRKAGLPMDYWSNTVQVWRYTTESFGRRDV